MSYIGVSLELLWNWVGVEPEFNWSWIRILYMRKTRNIQNKIPYFNNVPLLSNNLGFCAP